MSANYARCEARRREIADAISWVSPHEFRYLDDKGAEELSDFIVLALLSVTHPVLADDRPDTEDVDDLVVNLLAALDKKNRSERLIEVMEQLGEREVIVLRAKALLVRIFYMLRSEGILEQ